MSNQIVISSGAKVRNLDGVLTGTSGIVNALGINVPSGIPQLDGSGKILVSQLPNSVMEYKGSWNAATNTPTLVNGTGNAGDVYLCEVAGTVNFGAGPITFAVGDQVIYSGAIWQRASGATGTVTSVAVTESGDALTITGSPITTSGTINIGFAGNSGQYVNGAGGLTTFPSLTGFVPYTGATANVDLGTRDLTSRFIYLNGTGTTGGNLFLRQDIDPAYLLGYTSIYATDENIGFGSSDGTNLKKAIFSFGSLTDNTLRTYTLPDLSGTLALLEGTQTFSGEKTFGTDITFNGYALMDIGVALAKTSGTPLYGSTNGYANLQLVNAGSVNSLYLIDGDTLKYSKLSFNNAADYTYTFPNASGTLALTSNLSAYVPYTGATTNVDLGSNYITSATIVFWKGTGSGLGNIGIGRIVPLGQNTTGQGNIGIGENSLFSNTTGSNNIAIGVSSTQANTTGINNIAIGLGSNSNNVTGSGNVALGVGALNFNTTNYNTAVGHLSLYYNTTGTNNVALGYASLYTNTIGSSNTSIGYQSLYLNTTGNQNTALGHTTLFYNTTGASNTAIGTASLLTNTTGTSNTGIGIASLGSNTTGSDNIAIGKASGFAITTGSNNTIIGNYAGTAAMNNNIVLADGAGNIRYQWNGTNNVFGNPISGTSASFASSGGSDTFAINHSSGSGIALNITKGGNGEGLYINKTSGSGNALTVIGSTSLGALSGTSATFSVASGGYAATLNGPSYGGLILSNGGTANTYFVGESSLLSIEHITAINLRTNNADRVRITSGGNVGIGTSSPSVRLDVGGASNADSTGRFFKTGEGTLLLGGNRSTSNCPFIGSQNNYDFAFITNDTERMRITSGGNVLINRSSLSGDAGGALFQLSQSNANWIHYIENTASTGTIYGSYINFKNQAPNNNVSFFTYFADSSAPRFYVYSNGGLANYQGNDVNLSDERVKKDIIPLESYWDKFKAIEIVKFKYKDQTHDDFNIGVIAQQVEAVAPEFIDVDGWGETPEDGVPLKSVYTADLHHATIKVLQEAMLRIEEQQQQIEELKELIKNK
jgi:hypothetical protein